MHITESTEVAYSAYQISKSTSNVDGNK